MDLKRGNKTQNENVKKKNTSYYKRTNFPPGFLPSLQRTGKKKGLWQNSICLPDKSLEETQNRGI